MNLQNRRSEEVSKCVCVCMLLRLDLGYSEFPLASFLLSLSNSHLEAPVASIKEAPEAATKPAACITPFRQSPQLFFFVFFIFFIFMLFLFIFLGGGIHGDSMSVLGFTHCAFNCRDYYLSNVQSLPGMEVLL